MKNIDTSKAYGDAITAKRWLVYCGYWPVHTEPTIAAQLWGHKKGGSTVYAVGKKPGVDEWYIVEWLNGSEPPTDIVVSPDVSALFDW